MSDAENQTVLEPFFLEGSAGHLFCVSYRPAPGRSVIGNILYIPPFAEEMNKSRRLASLQAKALAVQGFSVLMIDLFGTGDSEGEFPEARWEIWCDDLLRGVQWLEQRQAAPILLWGVRLGALLAVNLVDLLPAGSVRLIFWQPVLNGGNHIRQFLRLRVAAEMIGGGDSTSTKSILSEIEQGELLEVAGYELHSDLVASINGHETVSSPIGLKEPVIWLEIVTAIERPILPASRRIIDQWMQSDVSVHSETVVGEAFWTATEIVVVPDLIERTSSCLQAG